jgi:hypothetical protein
MFKGPAKANGPSAHLTQMFGTTLLDAAGKSVDTASVIKSPSERFFDVRANHAARLSGYGLNLP